MLALSKKMRSFLLSGCLPLGFSVLNAQDKVKITSSVEEAEVGSLLDANEPSSSSDYRISRLSFHPKRGSTEWVQYEFPAATRIENIGVYWFDEAQAGAYVRNERKEILPRSWKLLIWKDDQWQAAKTTQDQLGVERD